MVKLTIELDDDVARRVADLSIDRGLTPEVVAAEVVTERFRLRRKLGFIGMGRSGRDDLSERLKELRNDLAAES